MTDAQKECRTVSAWFAAITLTLSPFLYFIAQIDAAPFPVVLVKVLLCVVVSLAATVCIVAFLASLEGFKGDDAFREVKAAREATEMQRAFPIYTLPTIEQAEAMTEDQYERLIERIVDILDGQYTKHRISTETYGQAFEMITDLDKAIIRRAG